MDRDGQSRPAQKAEDAACPLTWPTGGFVQHPHPKNDLPGAGSLVYALKSAMNARILFASAAEV